MIEGRPEPALDALTLRIGTLADLDAVVRVMDAAFSPIFGEGWTRSQCAGILPMSGVVLTLAERNGEVVGFSLLRAIVDEAELLLLAVAPRAQKRGIGHLLLDRFITDARMRGAHRLHLEVRDGNDAMALYQAAGFEPVGRRIGYYRGLDGSRRDAVTLAFEASRH